MMSTGGRIVQMEAFLAFLEHVHSMLTTTYHNTPIMLMASPQWSRFDCEELTRYIFEKTKTPALCILHSAIATQYGLKWPSMTVVDIGYEKVDVTCIFDNRIVNHLDLGDTTEEPTEKQISCGEVFTQKLMALLKDKNFSYEMAEQLKKSNVCEVLPYVPNSPQLMELPSEAEPVNATAAPASASEGPRIVEPQGVADDGTNGAEKPENDGVLDVASIVTSGQTKEFLAKKEKEKAEKGKPGKRGRDKEADAATSKNVRLPKTKRVRNVNHFEELEREEKPRHPEVVANNPEASAAPAAAEAGAAPAAATEAGAPAPSAEAPTDESSAEKPADANGAAADAAAANPAEPVPAPPVAEEAPVPAAPAPPAPAPAPAPAASSAPVETELGVKKIRKDIEVGLERFTFAERAEIDRIVATIYRAVQGIEDMYMRPSCWDNIVFVGNGSRIRGLKENILLTLTARHLISPSSATMFTSELPSNLATPSGTGSQTPTGNFTNPPHQLPTSSSVNPLLQAATTASLALPSQGAAVPGAPPSNAGDVAGGHSHHFHSQTPTSIKLAALPTYLGEWTKNGYEESMFLVAQEATRKAKNTQNKDALGQESQRFMSLHRIDFK